MQTGLRDLFGYLKGDLPLRGASKKFSKMLGITQEMVITAGTIFWGEAGDNGGGRERLYEQDLRVNKLQRKVRKSVVVHLSGPLVRDVPQALLLMSLVKDIERLGDYAKNLSEVRDVSDAPLPNDDIVDELKEVRQVVERLAQHAPDAFTGSDQDMARELSDLGRSTSRRCDELVKKISQSNYSAAVAVKVTLGTRFYKRICAHLLNLLSAVLMPLHKLDYYDEKYLA